MHPVLADPEVLAALDRAAKTLVAAECEAFGIVRPGNRPKTLVGFDQPEMTQAARGCNPPDGPHGLARFAADQPHRNPSGEGSTSDELCS